MHLRALINSPKRSVKSGEWKRGGEAIPRAQWPSRRAKAKAYKFGPAYQWRIVSFFAEGEHCRLKLLFNEDKQIFRARLGVTRDGETIVVCDYEFHASEPGWHCHARCDDIDKLDATATRYGGARIPSSKSRHRRTEFKFRASTLSAQTAFNCAVTFFKLDKGEGDVL
jgi:hypothetical protein